MLEILVKSDDKKVVSINQNGELIAIEPIDKNMEHAQDEDTILSSLNDSTGKVSTKRKRQQKKQSFQKFIYDGTCYIKADDIYLRVFPDDYCEKIASSTYYRFRERKYNEA